MENDGKICEEVCISMGASVGHPWGIRVGFLGHPRVSGLSSGASDLSGVGLAWVLLAETLGKIRPSALIIIIN